MLRLLLVPVAARSVAALFRRATPIVSIRASCGALLLGLAVSPAHGQERYDDHELRDRFRIAVGGFRVDDVDSTIRLDSKSLGLGTIIDLEQVLAVEDTASVARIDGHFRFNRAHRIEWSNYAIVRNGATIVVNDELQIGDVVFPVDYRIDSEWKARIIKVGYAWSFVNTSRYEMFIGAGLNIRSLSATFIGTNTTGETMEQRIYDEDGSLPLPTLAAGMRYNISDRLAVDFRNESFTLEVGDSSGRMQDTLLLLNYELTPHFGIGGGLNSFNFDLKVDTSDDFRGEIESSYRGLLLYVSARF